MAAPAPAPMPQTSPVQIIQQDGVFHVTLNIARLSVNDPLTASLVVWFSSLSSNDRVQLFVHTGSSGIGDYPDPYMPLLNAILLCKAQVIGIVDHIFADYSAYVLLSCQSLCITRFGQITLSPLWSDAEDKLLDREQSQMDAVLYLLERAVSKGWLLDDELDTLKERHTVFLSKDKLQGRLGLM